MPVPYRVLAIDGGGIRGIIPAAVLADLERRIAPRALAEVFDLIVGTSTGGILALALAVPDGGRPRHTAERLLGLYESEAETIFPGGGPQTLTQRVFGTRDPGAWFRDPVEWLLRRSSQHQASRGARYPLEGLERVLEHYLGDVPLAEAVADVIVTSYDMAYREPVMFSSRERAGFVTDVSMLVAARATSAGPTYFEPRRSRAPAARGCSSTGACTSTTPRSWATSWGTRRREATVRSCSPRSERERVRRGALRPPRS